IGCSVAVVCRWDRLRRQAGADCPCSEYGRLRCGNYSITLGLSVMEVSMAKCKTCGSSEFRKEIIPRHQDDLMGGIPVVVIDGVEQEICAVCGEVRGIK